MRLLATACLLFSCAAAQAFDLPRQFVHGMRGEPVLQPFRAAPGFWVLRQSKRSNFEAPFVYLIAGRDRALLLDTGAAPAPGTTLPLRKLVDDLLGKPLPLVVAHSHGHGDHLAGDAQFADRPDTVVVGKRAEDVAKHFGLARWPEGEARVDLGGRELIVFPLPGHEPAHIAVYDVATKTLLSGDTLYPGMLTVRDLAAFRASVARLAAFVDSHPVERVLGAHIEMSKAKRVMYPLETPFQPEEHALALGPEHVRELARAVAAIGDFMHDEIHDDFVLNRVRAATSDKASTHGMLVAGTDAVYFSHLPMFRAPHDYQLILEAQLPADALALYRADAEAHPDAMYTVVPTADWKLTEKIEPDASFAVDLYRGHFERGGARIAENVEATVARIVHFRRFENAAPSAQWIAFGRGAQRFAAHRIEHAPDFDQVVQLRDGAAREGSAVELGAKALAEDSAQVQRVIYTEYDDLK